MIALLALAALAMVAALVFPASARWAWGAAAMLTAAWIAAGSGLAAGVTLLVTVLLATALEPPLRPAAHGFEDLVARLAAVVIGIAGAVLVVVRVLQSDLSTGLAEFLLVLMALAVAVHLMGRHERAEQARAVRLGIALATAGWVAGNHPGLAVPLTAGMLMLLTVLVARTPEPA